MRILAFFHHNPWPPRSGNYRHCLEVLTTLVREGAEVYLASSTRLTPWSDAAVAALRAQGLRDVFVFRAGRRHRIFEWLQFKLQRGRTRLPWRKGVPPCSWWMRLWFSRRIAQVRPDVVIVNYALSDDILDHRRHRGCLRVLQMHDLLSVNVGMQEVLQAKKDEFFRSGIAGDYFDADVNWTAGLAAAAEEMSVYDRYDLVLAVSHHEQDALRAKLKHARVAWLPIVVPPTADENQYDGAALFMASAHAFNRQGLLFFIARILPEVRAKCPDFSLNVLGDIANVSHPAEGLRFLGFCQEAGEIWRHAAFFAFPVLSGTGQPVKVIEAMAHGIPVIVLARPVFDLPVEHGVNGLVAANASEFAEHVLTLWRDRGLCRRLGAAARESARAREKSHARISVLFDRGDPGSRPG